ncbi:hypothetical protein BU251_07410 [Candidatus Velamenicoccus archaeovorus]|uniref:Outer membrane efflux protein n=1 Tax=Velamenicoccus archaeovorus TaxID=1930593 RepID=A0A410P5T8_VELA1|nr:hypothetical protein BU251_07410 [Candidatus Velamenicoccus archaeovorus]
MFVFFLFDSVITAAEELDLKRAMNEALEANPEILSAKRSYEAANARIWQAASLTDPMFSVGYDKMTADRMLTGEPMKTYEISQDIPFPTKLFLRAKVASKLAKMAYENYQAKEKEIISQVKSAYAELFVIYREIEVNKEDKSILEQLSQSAVSRYKTGEGPQADVLKAQVELASVDTELVMLEQRRLTAQGRLNVLLNRDPQDELGAPSAGETIKFSQTLQDCYALAKQNNPELKAYRYAIDKGQAAYHLAQNEFLPDFRVTYKQMMNDEKSWAGMVGVTVPLWFFQKQAFGVKEMKSELEMVKAEYAAKEKAVLFDVRDAYARVEANKKLIELYETSFLPQAEETLEASLKGYESNQSDFLTLLDSRRMLIDFKLKHYNAILELKVALADLERAIGTDLDGSQVKEVAYEKK